MITPEYLDDVVRGTEEAVNRLNEALVQKITKRILAGFKFDGEVKFIPSTVHDLQKLAANGLSLEEIERTIQEAMPGMEQEIADAFRASAAEISNGNIAQMQNAIKILGQDGQTIVSNTPQHEIEGIPQSAKDLNLTAPEVRRLEAAYRRTKGEVKNLCRTTAGAANSAYIEACDDTYMKIQAGVSPNDAIVEAIRAMGAKGVTTVTYPSGRTDRIEVAVARAVRTGINQANAEISLIRAAEMGVKHVRVSAHLGARVTKEMDYTNHAHWQGQVYSLDYNKPALKRFKEYAKEGQEEYPALQRIGKRLKELWDKLRGKKPEYEDFVEACGYGEMLGICGINCRHTFTAFIPGINENPPMDFSYEENAERYKLTQRQRAMERGMRATKREIAALKGVNSPEAKEALREARRKLAEQDAKYQEFNRKNGLKGQNWRREIAQ